MGLFKLTGFTDELFITCNTTALEHQVWMEWRWVNAPQSSSSDYTCKRSGFHNFLQPV